MLINSFQIEANLRRTASKGYISLLNHEVLENLAFKYFGIKDEYGNIIGYQCPYSGEVYTDYRNIVLEHIIPVDSKGGTVLFNCIPTSSEVNKTSEKGAKHLITWWTNSKYWDNNALQRLEKLVNYILEAYEKVFEEHTLEELETSYLDFDLSEEITINNDLELSEQQESLILKKQGEQNGIHSYLGFILSCIETLEKYNVNTIEIRSKLKDLENKHIFENIDRFQLFQNILQQVIIKRLGDDNRSYLTYLLKFDIKKLMDSIEYPNKDQIYNEIDLRLKNIENILKENNLSIIEYFKIADDITDIDIIYKNINSITEDDKVIFLENVKLGIDSKINIFIEMLNKGNSNILKVGNTETLEGYPSIPLAHFWSNSNNRTKIMQKLFEDLKDNSKYDSAREIIDLWLVENNIGDKKIKIFIDMLNKGNSDILKVGNKETLEGYPSIPLAQFWKNCRNKIMQKLFEDLKGNPEYNVARKIVDSWLVKNNIGDKKINIFIDMLNRGDSNILKNGNTETLEGYPSIPLDQFWSNSNNRTKIMQKLFEDLKDNSKYDSAREIIDLWLVENNIGDKKIKIFIDMLNKGNNNILITGNKETLEGYPSITLANFWSSRENKNKVIKKLFQELKDDSKYDVARKIIDLWLVENNIGDKKIKIFIDMLNKGNSDILTWENKETLEGYPNIKLARFWSKSSNRTKIIEKLFEDLKDNPGYNVARKIVDNWLVVNELDRRIEIFIEMLNKGNSNILTWGNKETLEGYPSIPLDQFWSNSNNRTKIMQKLFLGLKNNPNYNTARQIVLTNLKVSSYEEYLEKAKKKTEIDHDKKIEIFIGMLNKGNSDILKQRTEATLEGYPSITLSQFWSRRENKDKIMQKLFIELKDNPDYSTARQIVLTNLKVSSYEEYLEKERKSKELKELKKMKKQLESVDDALTRKENVVSRKRA